MTDGTRPAEGENSAATPPPVPPYAADVPPAAGPTPPYAAQVPPPAAQVPPYAASVPPYAASNPPHSASVPPYAASNPPYAASVPPYGQTPTQAGAPPAGYAGRPRQEYPGAPPTWGPQPPAPWQQQTPPARGGSALLAALALGAAIVGFVLSFLAWFLGGLLFVTAIVLAVVSLVRRAPGKGMSIAAIVVAAFGAVFSVFWVIITLVFTGFSSFLWNDTDTPYDPVPEEDYSYPSLSVPELDADGNTLSDPLAPGTAITIVDDTAGEDVWQMTVGPFEDISAEVLANSEETPVNGAFVAVPIELTNLGDEVIDLTTYEYVPYASFLTDVTGEAESAYILNPDDHPGLWDVGATETGTVEPGETVTYYEVYDVEPDAVTSGSFLIDLDSGQTVFWGPGTL